MIKALSPVGSRPGSGRRPRLGGPAQLRIQAEPPRPVGRDIEQPAHHRDVFHEVNHLILVAEVRMEHERGRNHKEKEQRGAPRRPIAEQDGKTRPDLDDDRAHVQKRRPGRHAHGGHVLLRPLRVRDLVDARQEKNHRDANSADQR
jgi:hypothetical protein